MAPCTVNPAFVYTRYPCDLDDPRPSVDTRGLPISIDLQTPVKSEVVNRQRESILAIEGELGLKPSGTFTTVRDRLDALEAGSGGGGSPLTVSLNSTDIENHVTGINFVGSAVNVVSTGVGKVDVTITGGSGTTQFIQESVPVTANNQTAFSISYTPTTASSVSMYVNGVSQTYFTDFSVAGTNITYLNTNTPLSPTDIIVFKYYRDIGSITDFDPAVIFDTLSDRVNIRSDRATIQSPIDNTKIGITNLGNDTSGTSLGATADYSSILGGDQGATSSSYSAIVGGLNNRIGQQDPTNSGTWTTAYVSNSNIIAGGDNNGISFAGYCGIFAGGGNRFEEDTGTYNTSISSVILSGSTNKIINASFSGIICGSNNSFLSATTGYSTSSSESIILAGLSNTIRGSDTSAILAGSYNILDKSYTCYISGYNNNIFGSFYCTISGGLNNKISYFDYSSGGGNNHFIGSGQYNHILGNVNSIIGGGYYNKIKNGDCSGIFSGTNNSIGLQYADSNGSISNVDGSGIVTFNVGSNLSNYSIGSTITISNAVNVDNNGSFTIIDINGSSAYYLNTFAVYENTFAISFCIGSATSLKNCIVGGAYNKIWLEKSSNDHNFIGGGSYNIIHEYATNNSIIGGYTNILSSGNSNTISGRYNLLGDAEQIISAPLSNVILGNTNQLSYFNYNNNGSTITGVTYGVFGVMAADLSQSNAVFGYQNTLEGGYNNFVSGTSNQLWTFGYSYLYGNNVVGGSQHSITSGYTTVTGLNNIATSLYSVVQGKNAYANKAAQLARAAYQFNKIGDAQKGEIIIQGQNTNGQAVYLQTSDAFYGLRLDDSQTYEINSRVLITSITNSLTTPSESRARFVNSLLLHQTDGYAVLDENYSVLNSTNGTSWAVDYTINNSATVNSGSSASIGVMSGFGYYRGSTGNGFYLNIGAYNRLPLIGNYNFDFITVSGSSAPENNGTFSGYIADARRISVTNSGAVYPDSSSVSWKLTFLPKFFLNYSSDSLSTGYDNVVLVSGLSNMKPTSIGRYLTILNATDSKNNGTFKIIACISDSVVLIENPQAVSDGYSSIPDLNNGFLTWTEKESRLEVAVPVSVTDIRDRRAIATLEWRELSNTTPIIMGIERPYSAPYTGAHINNSLSNAGSGKVLLTQPAFSSESAYTSDMVGYYVTISGSESPANNGYFLITDFVDSKNIKISNPYAMFPAVNSVLVRYKKPSTALYYHKKLAYGKAITFDIYPPETKVHGPTTATTEYSIICVLRSSYVPVLTGLTGIGTLMTFEKIQQITLSDGFTYDCYQCSDTFNIALNITATPDVQATISSYDSTTGLATLTDMTSGGSGIMTANSVGRYVDIYSGTPIGAFLIKSVLSSSSVTAYIPGATAGDTVSWYERKKTSLTIS